MTSVSPPAPGGATRSPSHVGPEQRWTAALSALLTAAIWLFGHPDTTVVVRRPDDRSAQSRRSMAAPLVRTPTIAPVPGNDVWDGAVASSTSGPELATGSGTATDPAPPTAAGGGVTVVALTTSDGAPPGRDDASIARVFLREAGVEARVVPVGDDVVATCTAVAGAGTLAIASVGLPDSLRRCLAGRGVSVLAFDGLGPLPGATGGGVFSTRRGVRDSLIDVARWAARDRVVRGRAAVVASATVRSEVERAIAEMRAAGLDIADVVFVSDDAGPAPADIARVADASDAVVFAAPSRSIAQWSQLHSLIDPGVTYLVSDAFDAIWGSPYPPALAGALARTSVRLGWYEREVGETDLQAACRRTWETAATPPMLLGKAETVRVYAWCLHARLAAAVTADVANTLAAMTSPSPLTSDLGPLPGGNWGPRQDAVLSWNASCTCWQQVRPFADRAGP